MAATAAASATPLAAASAAVVPVVSDAQSALALLPVKGRAPLTGYDRSQFGQAWADVDRNGCDTRNDVLRRDLTAVIEPGTHGCVVLSGTLADPYSGRTIAFVRGRVHVGAVQIDHVVALGDAWQTGAQQWTPPGAQRSPTTRANCSRSTAPSTSRRATATRRPGYRPPSAYRCTYVSRQIAVKQAYGLWVTAAEHDAMARVLAGCPGATAPPVPSTTAPPPSSAAPAPTTPTPVASTPAAPAPAPATTAPAPPPADPGGVYYTNCAAARAAGAAPLYRGQPGYRPGLDRDGDGIACET